jgi:hypothetical protein
MIAGTGIPTQSSRLVLTNLRGGAGVSENGFTHSRTRRIVLKYRTPVYVSFLSICLIVDIRHSPLPRFVGAFISSSGNAP